MYKIPPVLNLPNEEDNLILKINANGEHWSAVLKSKKEKSSANITVEVLIKHSAIILRSKKKFIKYASTRVTPMLIIMA